jgi:cell division protein FtsB
MSRPHNVASHWRHISRNRRVVLFFFIQLLNIFQLLSVILENNVQFRIQLALQCLTLQNHLKLFQKLQRLFNGRNVLEALIDESLQSAIQVRNLQKK